MNDSNTRLITNINVHMSMNLLIFSLRNPSLCCLLTLINPLINAGLVSSHHRVSPPAPHRLFSESGYLVTERGADLRSTELILGQRLLVTAPVSQPTEQTPHTSRVSLRLQVDCESAQRPQRDDHQKYDDYKLLVAASGFSRSSDI